MRRAFFRELHKWMGRDKEIYAITGDLGWGGFDKIEKDFPERFINVGVAEQTMMDVAVGLALSGKKPFVYSITPFLIYRPFETIRNYIDHDKIPVRMVGAGRNQDYSRLGFTHWAEDDRYFMGGLRNIHSMWPSHADCIPSIMKTMVEHDKPYYLNLTR